MYTAQDLEKHLEEERSQGAIFRYLKEIVYGGIDGIITTFAVIAGFTGASLVTTSDQVYIPVIAILIFGIARCH